MAKLIILSGVPGSGKSYFSHLLRDHKKGGHVYIVSSDSLRDQVTGNQQDLSEDDLMWKLFFDLARVYSKDPNGIVVLDSTNASRHYRIEAGSGLRSFFDTIDLISFHMKPETIYRQNLDREWPLPTEVLTHYIETFEYPTRDDYAFFDHVYLVEKRDFSEIVNKY